MAKYCIFLNPHQHVWKYDPLTIKPVKVLKGKKEKLQATSQSAQKPITYMQQRHHCVPKGKVQFETN